MIGMALTLHLGNFFVQWMVVNAKTHTGQAAE